MTVTAIDESRSFGSISKWIVGLTGVLLVVPALVNAAADIWTSVRNLPTTVAEKDNVAMFQKHFGEPPLHRGEIPILTDLGTVKMELEVHKGGDIYVRYGQRSQWFHSPLARTESASVWINSAKAAPGRPIRLAGGKYVQRDNYDGGRIVRERLYESGKTEKYEIDKRTGIWSAPKIGDHEERIGSSERDVPFHKYPEIDIRR